MADFELRIYQLTEDDYEEVLKASGTDSLCVSDNEFIDKAEETGRVFTLATLVNSYEDGCYTRGYLIPVNGENIDPIPVSGYDTTLTVSQVSTSPNGDDTKVVLYNEKARV